MFKRRGKYFVEVDFKWNLRKQDARHEFALTNAKTLRGESDETLVDEHASEQASMSGS